MEDVYIERPAPPSFVRAIVVAEQNAETIKELLALGIVSCSYEEKHGRYTYALRYTNRPDERPHLIILTLGNYIIFEQDGELRPWPMPADEFERRFMPAPISPEYQIARGYQRVRARAAKEAASADNTP